MLNTDELTSMLRDQSGTALIADFGLVHQGRMGYADCKTSVGIELWQGMHFVYLQVVHQKNRAGRDTRVVKWPYSRTSPTDLDRVLADIKRIENLDTEAALPDDRGWFARGFDRLIGREHLGDYAFASPLVAEALFEAEVTATVSRMGGQLEVTLSAARPGRGSIVVQFPQVACGCIRQALADYA